MNLLSITLGTTCFLLILFIHIILWRFFYITSHIKSLFFAFLFLPFIILISIFIINIKLDIIKDHVLLSSILLYFSIACAYIQTFPAIQANAPSLNIVYWLNQEKNGLTEDEIESRFSDYIIQDRIDDLILEGLVYKKEDVLFLTDKGFLLANIFYFYRKIYGLKPGQG